MVFAWPVLAWLGIGMARHMKPALPNGGWFLLHRILVITSLVFTCISFALIFIAFRNTEYRGLISLGDIVRNLWWFLFCVSPYVFVYRTELGQLILSLASLW